jgi:DNA-binding response OmpR family regulator
MSHGHVLVVTDSTEAADQLAHGLLPQAGFSVTLANDFTPPPSCDAVLVDVTQLRGNPLAGLKAQRRMGCDTPAMLIAHRLTEQMAADVFALNVREFIQRPVEPSALLEHLDNFVAQILREREQAAIQSSLEKTQVALARRLNEMKALSRIGRSISTLSDLFAMLDRIVEAAAFLTRSAYSAIYLLDEHGKALGLYAQQGLDEAQVEAMRWPQAGSDPAQVFQTGQPAVGDASNPHITVPIVGGQRTIGVLAVYGQQGMAFEDSDQAVLSSLADYAAIAIDKVTALARLEARVDAALTGARTVGQHADTLFDPVEGIESQVDTLLAGGFGQLTESQRSAISRVKLAADRLKEIAGYIREALDEAASGS